MSHIDGFYNAMEDFLIAMRRTFPEMKEIYTIQNKIAVGQATKPKYVITQFMEQISPYYKPILDKDEEFFRTQISKTYNKTFNEVCDNLGALDRTKTMIDTILKTIGKEWDLTLSDQTKQAIWNHLKVLLIMGSMAYDNGITYIHIIKYASSN